MKNIGTMASQLQQIRITALLLLTISTTQAAKNSARPVHEIVNEQARIDDKARLTNNPGLPYGNPLAGNNARIHAQNQQAMFNAERVRQHRAQIQRWTKAPLPVDSYMKAYHESQESHQLAVEQAQANLRDKKLPNAPKPATKPRQQGRQDSLKRGPRVIPEVTKITKADAIVKEKNRNHRSYGSVDYHQYLEPKMYKSVYLSPGPTYDQGVTIKPNGNVGLASLKQMPEEPKLFTEAIPSKTRYVYPKQYSQMQSYESAKDIEALNALLKKTPQVQVSELNSLLSPENTEGKDVLNTPIDLYFYVKDHNAHSFTSQDDVPPTYASAYMPQVKDHTPITEEIDDIENPNRDPKLKSYGLHPVVATQVPEILTTTTKNNNYYKVEVASQTISTGYKPNDIQQYVEEEKEYHAQPLVYDQKKPKEEGDLSDRYLHHNAQNHGIQHLSEDGIGVSAYGDENVSKTKNSRQKRSLLKPAPFVVPEQVKLTEKPVEKNNTPKAEPLRLVPFTNQKRQEIQTFLTTPNFPIGVAVDYQSEYEEIPVRKQKNRGSLEFVYDDEEGNEYEDDFSSPDYEYGAPNVRPSSLFSIDRPKNYAPSIGYNQNADLTTSFSNKYGNIKRYPGFSNYKNLYPSYLPPTAYGVPHTYDVPQIPQSYNIPQAYGVPLPQPHPQYGLPVRYGVPNIPHNLIEPVYMPTHSQLKNLIGPHNLNIQHLDVFQYPFGRKPYTKSKKRYPYRRGSPKKHIHKLHRLNIL